MTTVNLNTAQVIQSPDSLVDFKPFQPGDRDAPYVIGYHSLDLIERAVLNEFEHGIPPLVVNSDKQSTKTTMEYYCFLVIKEALRRTTGKYLEKVDGCLANALYSNTNRESLCLALQLRVTDDTQARQQTQQCWRFTTESACPGMLMILRSIRDMRTWIIPYDLLCQFYRNDTTGDIESIDIPFGNGVMQNGMRWNDFLKSNDQLAEYISFCHEKAKENICLQLFDRVISHTPCVDDIEGEVSYRRQFFTLLKSIEIPYKLPRIKINRHDYIMSGFKMLEKPANNPVGSGYGYLIKLDCQDSAAMKKLPYSVGDFDLLMAHLRFPLEDYFYLIPAWALVEQGILKHDTCDGMNGFSVYPPVLLDTRLSKLPRETRANDFFLTYNDSNIKSKIMSICNSQSCWMSDPSKRPPFFSVVEDEPKTRLSIIPDLPIGTHAIAKPKPPFKLSLTEVTPALEEILSLSVSLQ